jgi:hypothetical protein
MTEQEQQRALADAGFARVQVELGMNGLLVYASEKAVAAAGGRRDHEPPRVSPVR